MITIPGGKNNYAVGWLRSRQAWSSSPGHARTSAALSFSYIQIPQPPWNRSPPRLTTSSPSVSKPCWTRLVGAARHGCKVGRRERLWLGTGSAYRFVRLSASPRELCETRATTDPSPPDYLRLLDLASSFNARKFARPDYMFLVAGSSQRRREYIAAFNEEEAAKTYADVSVTPDILHQEILRYMAVLTLKGKLEGGDSTSWGPSATVAAYELCSRGAATQRSLKLID